MPTSSSSRGARGWIVAPALDGRAGMVGMGGTGVQLADARTKHAPDQMVHVVHHRQMSHLGVTHPAAGLMRRLVDASCMRIPVPFRSRPKWSRRIPTGIARGIGHGHASVFMKSHWQQGGIRSWRLPHRTPRIRVNAEDDVRRTHRASRGCTASISWILAKPINRPFQTAARFWPVHTGQSTDRLKLGARRATRIWVASRPQYDKRIRLPRF